MKILATILADYYPVSKGDNCYILQFVGGGYAACLFEGGKVMEISLAKLRVKDEDYLAEFNTATKE